jgi:hypothetical protein
VGAISIRPQVEDNINDSANLRIDSVIFAIVT